VTVDPQLNRGAKARREQGKNGGGDLEALEALSSRVLQFQDEERRQTSRFLHDATAQNLLALKMNLERALTRAGADNDPLRGLIAESMQLAETSLAEIRMLSYALHPPILDEAGLGPSLRWYARVMGERMGISIRVDIPEDFGRFPRGLETAIFRIAQEAIGNIERHSGSREAFLRVANGGPNVTLEVEDRGKGMAIPPRSGTPGTRYSGFGLVGMEERTKQLGGMFSITSELGKGTTIRVTLPLEAPAAVRAVAAAASGRGK
jgi:two-component system, NarL family, sensor kinase